MIADLGTVFWLWCDFEHITCCHPALQVVFYLTDLRGEIWVLFASWHISQKTKLFLSKPATLLIGLIRFSTTPGPAFTIDSPSQHLTLTRPLEMVRPVGIKAVRGEVLRRARPKHFPPRRFENPSVSCSVVATPWRRAVCQHKSLTSHSYLWSPTLLTLTTRTAWRQRASKRPCSSFPPAVSLQTVIS